MINKLLKNRKFLITLIIILSICIYYFSYNKKEKYENSTTLEQSIKEYLVKLDNMKLVDIQKMLKKNKVVTNVALLGTAKQNTTTYGGVASRAIDNNPTNDWKGRSMTHTNKNGLWEVKLDKKYKISNVKTYNRRGYEKRSVGLVIEIYNGKEKVYDSITSDPNISKKENLIYEFVIPEIYGDKVKVIAANNQYLSLGEVQVMRVLSLGENQQMKGPITVVKDHLSRNFNKDVVNEMIGKKKYHKNELDKVNKFFYQYMKFKNIKNYMIKLYD